MKSTCYAVALYCLLCCLSGACSPSRLDQASGLGTQGKSSFSRRLASNDHERIAETLYGKAAWYSTRTNGSRTASGEPLNNNSLTAAHRSLPFGTRVRVTNKANDAQVIVRITDRGPFGKGRIIDLSLAAAKQIDMINAGVVPVRVDVLK